MLVTTITITYQKRDPSLMDRAKRQRVAEMMEQDDGYDSETASTDCGSSTRSSVNYASEAISVVLTDPKLLDCPICYNPFHGYIFQVTKICILSIIY